MANVLTDLAADIYVAAEKVGRKQVGFVASSTVNTKGSAAAALNDTVRSSFTRAATASDVTPSMTVPEGTDQAVDNKTLTLNKFRHVPIPWTGEDIRHVNNGAGFETIYGAQILQAMETITQEVENDIAAEAYKNASRAVGVAGTTPFASNINLLNSLEQILTDNGMPELDGRLTLAINSDAGRNLKNLVQLQDVDRSGGSELLRQGTILDTLGFLIKRSAKVQTHTAGTGSGYLVNDAATAVGDTTIAADTGTGTILAGDVVTIGNFDYVVATALAGGSFTIGAPGLQEVVADNATITLAAGYKANVAFHQDAIEIAMRAPAEIVIGGQVVSQAIDSMIVQDPHSGLSFSVGVYGGFHKAMISVSAVWGVKAWEGKFIANLLG